MKRTSFVRARASTYAPYWIESTNSFETPSTVNDDVRRHLENQFFTYENKKLPTKKSRRSSSRFKTNRPGQSKVRKWNEMTKRYNNDRRTKGEFIDWSITKQLTIQSQYNSHRQSRAVRRLLSVRASASGELRYCSIKRKPHSATTQPATSVLPKEK